MYLSQHISVPAVTLQELNRHMWPVAVVLNDIAQIAEDTAVAKTYPASAPEFPVQFQRLKKYGKRNT